MYVGLNQLRRVDLESISGKPAVAPSPQQPTTAKSFAQRVSDKVAALASAFSPRFATAPALV